ncbi:MAG: uracil-DNA glycosylase [Planctomycetes bacterium]|nr:uracil-DNA glycosylase [Planctomycetota bacterium]
MAADSNHVRAALRQQLEGDRLLGLKSVPIPQQLTDRIVPPGVLRRVIDVAENAKRLSVLDQTQVKDCRKCQLCETRTKTVFGQGSAGARLVVGGEAPGADEDREGLACVGRAGQLLTRMIAAMGLSRDEVFICNLLKCRPPNNRDPSAHEILSCNPYLHEQLAIIRPEVLVTLGAPASKTLLNTAQSIGKLRGRFHEYHLPGATDEGATIPVMPTYHPAYLLRSPGEKGKAWADLQMVMARLGLSAPAQPAGASN